MNPNNLIALLSSEEMHADALLVAHRLRELDERYSHAPVEYKVFANREIRPHITETIRSKDVYFLHSLYHPDPNTALMKLFLTANAMKLSSPRSISLILPYIPYLREDRRDGLRASISARMIADLIQEAVGPKLERIVTMDMHVEQEEGFFKVPIDNIPGRNLIADWIREECADDLSNVMVVSADLGGSKRAKRLTSKLGCPLGILEKARKEGSRVESMGYSGPAVRDKDVVLLDDMIDTANTTVAGIKTLQGLGAKSVTAACTHAIMSIDEHGVTAEEKLATTGARVVTTGSIPRDDFYYSKHAGWLTTLSIDRLLAEVIHASHCPNGSVSRQLG